MHIGLPQPTDIATSTDKSPVTTTTVSTSVDDSVGLVVGLLVVFVVVLISLVVVTICLTTLFVKKRKLKIRNLQLAALTR